MSTCWGNTGVEVLEVDPEMENWSDFSSLIVLIDMKGGKGEALFEEGHCIPDP
jgi:hypothetical protein